MKFLTIVTLCSVMLMVSAIETPKYSVLETITDSIEIRKYVATKWACTSTSGDSSMFWQLFNYISGQNDQSLKIPMTAPVLSTYDDNNKIIRQCFFIPTANQINTPQPTGPVFIVDEPEVTVAVSRFGGKATLNDYLEHKAKLIEALAGKNVQYITSYLLTAGYDSPTTPVANRTNEVFLVQLH